MNNNFKELGEYLKKDTSHIVKVYKDLNSDSYRYKYKDGDLIIWLSIEKLQESFISIDELLDYVERVEKVESGQNKSFEVKNASELFNIVDDNSEQKEIEKLYGHRKDTKDFLPGGSQELKKKVKEYFQMDELERKRDQKFLEKNKNTVRSILNFIANKEEIKANQETFKVDSLKNIMRMKELLNEVYNNKVLVLQNERKNYLTILSVNDKNNLFDVLNELLIDNLGKEYEVTHELLIMPDCLSFNNGEEKYYLHNWDCGFIEI